MSFAKDGYTPGEAVQMLIELDNTNCKANVSTISITVTNHVSLRSQGRATGDTKNLFSKVINGVPAGMAFVVLKHLFRATKPLGSSS